MSNIKIVYQRKLHKLPPKIQSHSEIVETVKNLYPQIKEVHLYTIINLTDPNGVEEINNDLDLTFLKKIYKQMGWLTIKLLVLENQNDQNQLKNSMDLLNQSQIILDKSIYQDKDKVNKITQKQDVDYQIDEKLKQTLLGIIDERLKYHNILNQNKEDSQVITKAKQLHQMFSQYPYNSLIDFVKAQGEKSLDDLIQVLLNENQ